MKTVALNEFPKSIVADRVLVVRLGQKMPDQNPPPPMVPRHHSRLRLLSVMGAKRSLSCHKMKSPMQLETVIVLRIDSKDSLADLSLFGGGVLQILLSYFEISVKYHIFATFFFLFSLPYTWVNIDQNLRNLLRMNRDNALIEI